MRGIKKTIRYVCGYILLVGGVIGLFLPILQGTLMIIGGAALLGWDLKFLKRIRERVSSRLHRKRGGYDEKNG